MDYDWTKLKEIFMIPIQTKTNKVLNAATEKLYDLGMISMLCRGNNVQLKKMVMVFIDQLPKSIEEIKIAYHNREFEIVKNTAHRIKPILGYYAIIKVEKDILQIEKWAAKKVTSPEMESKIDNLDKVITQIVDQLKNEFLYK